MPLCLRVGARTDESHRQVDATKEHWQTMTDLLATPNNMKRLENTLAGFFAYSRRTGEQCSATPGDYWNVPGDSPLLDETGEPMVLAYTRTETIIVQDAEVAR